MAAVPPTAAPRPTTPIPPSGGRRGRLGETGLSEGIATNAHSVAFDPCIHDPYRAAAPGNTIMFVDVTIENRSNPAVPGYGGFDWVLFDADGNRYHDNYMLPCRPRPDSPFLEIGVSVNRVLEFEIPGDAAGLVLRWDGLGTEASIDIELGE